MLNNITWQGYWVTLALLTAGYYLVIYFLYFRKDFQFILPKRGEHKTPTASPAVAAFLKEQKQPSLFPDDAVEFTLPAEGEESTVYSCMDEITAYFNEAKKGKSASSEVHFALQKILSKYSSLKNTPFKDAINGVIVSEAAHHCSIQFSSEEMRLVWLED